MKSPQVGASSILFTFLHILMYESKDGYETARNAHMFRFQLGGTIERKKNHKASFDTLVATVVINLLIQLGIGRNINKFTLNCGFI